MAIQNNLTFQLVPVLLDMVVLHHDDHHVNFIQELIKVQNLVLHDFFVGEERVEGLEGTSEVTLLDVDHLEGGAFTDVVYVLLVSEAVETHTLAVSDMVFFHNLVDAFQHEYGLVVVGLHALVNHLGQLGIVTHEEPGVNADAVATHTRARLQDVDTRVHVADADDFIHIHVVVTADATQFVGKSDVDGTVGVFHHLGHLGRAYVSDYDFTLAKTGVVFLHLLANLTAVGTDGAVIVEQFVDHVARDDAFGGMDEVDVGP